MKLIGNVGRVTAIVLIAALAGCAHGRRTPPASPADIEAGQKLWNENCVSCHFVPGRSLAFDRVWLNMLFTTS